MTTTGKPTTPLTDEETQEAFHIWEQANENRPLLSELEPEPLTAQETLDAWKDALRNSLALVEAYELSASDIEEEQAGKLPYGLSRLATCIGEELYMRRSWTLAFPRGPVELTEPFPLTEDGESLFGLIEELIKSADSSAQLEYDYGQASARGPRLSRKADYSKPFGWNFDEINDEMNRQMASSDNKREQAWKEEQGIIDIDGEPTFYAL